MEKTELRLEYDTYIRKEGSVSAIIVAAGSSTRMGGESKQLMTLGGIPVLARTLLAFERAKCIKNIVIVARDCDILPFQIIAEKYIISKVSDIVCGGCCREESVKNGVLRLGDDTEYVLIHDGARPLIEPELIERVAAAAEKFGAVTCGVPVKDTLKLVKDGVVDTTLDRSQIYSIQTPQGFNYKLFKECIAGIDDLTVYTDDCAVVESCGHSVHIVEGDYNNIKITTKEDISVASGILNMRGNV